uniref:Protein containing VCBS repeat n=2 Tax=Levilinea saccharolytica TaxID=229921 RepID=A0A0M8JRQ1_9CHLR|nr:protein containing VCBS repeat [Levilinea saccharolytica]
MTRNTLFSTCSSWNTSSIRMGLTRIRQVSMILIFLISLVGMLPPQPAQAASYTWVAYNDCAGTNSITNTTNILGVSGTGTLKNFDTGATLTGITAAFTSSGSPTIYGTNGANTNSGTDAYETFNGKANMTGSVNYGSNTGWYIDLTISGLDPAKTYTFATTANRDDSSYTTRISRYTISDISGATNASTSGVTVISNESVSFVTGYNRVNGYVARWTGIQPGSDGDFKVRADYPSNYQAYGMSVFMLAEEGSIPTTPTITTSGTLSAFSTTPGTASTAQTYTVSGSNLTGNVTITAPTGFQISTDGSTYTSALTLTPSGGTITSTPIYVHLFSPTVGDFSGNITHTGGGATEVDLAVSGQVSNQICYENKAFVTTADTYMSGFNNTNNYGAQTYMRVTLGTSQGRGSLLRWDLSSIPANAVVSAASLKLNVSTAGSATFNLYNMRRAWAEGTGSGSATGDGATWQTYDGTNAWGTNGAANTTSDRFNTNLWGAGSSSFSTTGSKTVALNTDGLDVVQGWIDGSIPNYGLTIQNYSTGSTDVQFATRDNPTEANRPALVLSYCVDSGITYTLTAANDGHGTVTLNPAGGVYAENTVVTLTPIPSSGYTFASWSGANAADLSNNGNGTWSLTMNANKSVQANFSLLPINAAPNQPVLVQPTDNATGVSTSPTLEVTVSDPDVADTLDVTFYGREAGATSSGEDFTLIVIPDTQNMTTSYPTVLNSMTQWIADNKTAENIVFATHTGDLVNTASSATEWGRVDTALDILDSAGIPYSVGPGNHDLYGSYNTYFGPSRFSASPSYQDSYASDQNENNYTFFSASGMDFIIINLQYGSTTAHYDWADALLKANPTRRGIVVKHDILNTDNSWNNQAPFTALKDNPNLFLMLCGHMHTASDGSAYRAELGDDGHTIHILLTDYQDYPNGGNAYLRKLRFSPSNDKIYASIYSPYVSTYLTNTSNYEQFEIAYDMPNGAAASFTPLGTVEDVANGGSASIVWNGRTNNTEYEWYAAASDGAASTDSPTWSFITGTVGPSHTVTFDANGGSGTMSPQVANTATPLTPNAFTRSGFTFSGWNTNAGGTGTSYADGAIYAFTADVTLYAQWAAIVTHTVTFNLGTHGTLTGGDLVQTVVHGGAAVAPTFTVESGWNFTGWDKTFTNVTTDLTVNATYAPTATCYTLTLSHTGSGSNPSAAPLKSAACAENGKYVSGENITLSGAVPTSGWQISGWTGTANNASTANTNTLVMPAADHTVSVQYSEIPTNTPPFARDDAYTTAEDTLLDVPFLQGLLLNDNDVDGDLIPTELVTDVTHGTLNLNINGAFTYLPDLNFNGTDSFTYRDFDGQAYSNVATVTLTVTAVNDAPTANAQSVSTVENTAKAVTLTGSDVEGSALTYAVVTPPAHGQLSGTAPNLTYTPSFNYYGEDSFTFKVNDGALDSTPATVSITVTKGNSAPVAVDDSYAVDEDLLLSISAPGVLGNDSDEDSDPLTVQLMADVSHGTLSLAANGSFTYQPGANYSGSDTFTYRASDGTALSNTATVTITVHPVNDPPVAQGQGVQINEDTAIEITLTATDTEGSALTYAVVTPPAHGQLSGSAPVLTYTPDLNYHGGDSFTFKANDGGLDSNIATVTITVLPVNDPPDAQDDTASVLENGSVDISVLNNDTDVDGDTLTISAYDALTPLGGTVSCTDTCLYTPPANTFGSDSFGYTISDGHGGTDSAAVAISIGSSNQAPTAVVDAYSTAEDTLLTVPAAQGVLSNDTDPDAGDVLSALKVTDPAHGDLNFNADGSFTYLPDANFNGEDSFSYQVKDAEADGSTAVVTLRVTPVNDAPTCQNASLATDEDVPAPWAHLCSDIDGDPLTLSVITAPAHGTLDTLANPMLYTPAANYFGADSFTYRVSDGTVNSNTAAVTVTIASVNDAPSALALSPAAVAEFMPAGTLIGDFSTTDADTADTHTYALVAGAGDTDNASFTITAGQLFTNAVFSQALTPTLSIRVRSTDSGAGNLTLEQVFTITILEGDAAPTLFSPTHQAKLLNNTPTFDWSDVPGADSYTLQISRYASFTKIFVAQEATASTLTLTSLLPSKARFYWRVCSHALGTTACSAAWYFTTANPPSTPTLLSPANGATVTSTRPRLDWNDAVLPPSTTFWRYEVQWSTDPTFTAPQNAFVSGWVRRSYYAPTTALTRGQTYYWRVRTFNTLGEYGQWSAVGSFRIAP